MGIHIHQYPRPPTCLLSNANPPAAINSTSRARNPNHLLSYKSTTLDWKGYLSIIKTTRDPYPSFCVSGVWPSDLPCEGPHPILGWDFNTTPTPDPKDHFKFSACLTVRSGTRKKEVKAKHRALISFLPRIAS